MLTKHDVLARQHLWKSVSSIKWQWSHRSDDLYMDGRLQWVGRTFSVTYVGESVGHVYRVSLNCASLWPGARQTGAY